VPIAALAFRAVERSFFQQVLDVFEGFVADVEGELQSYAHRRGLKVWFDDATREHYEAQFVRVDGVVGLEIGFHSEYPKAPANDDVMAAIAVNENVWREELGDEPVVGPFLGSDTWRRVSEVWDLPGDEDVDTVIEVAARLADYVVALEPLRRSAG